MYPTSKSVSPCFVKRSEPAYTICKYPYDIANRYIQLSIHVYDTINGVARSSNVGVLTENMYINFVIILVCGKHVPLYRFGLIVYALYNDSHS